MADPITLGVLAVTAVASTVSGVMSASAQQAQANQQANALRLQASQTSQAAVLQNQSIQQKADLAMGRQLALAGASGVDIDGSVLDDAGQTQANAARDIFTNNFNANAKETNAYISANNIDANASQGMTNALIGGGLKIASLAAGPLIGSLSGGAGPTFNSSTYGSPRASVTLPAGYRGYVGGGV